MRILHRHSYAQTDLGFGMISSIGDVRVAVPRADGSICVLVEMAVTTVSPWLQKTTVKVGYTRRS